MPQQVTVSTSQKVWWLGECGHEWESNVSSRSKGVGCPICSGNRTSSGHNDLASKNPFLASQWHPTLNILLPTDVTVHSGQKVWWICDKGHEWIARISDRQDGSQCPQCSVPTSNPEKEIEAFLTSLGLTVQISDRKVLNGKELDLYIPEQKIAIEFNGIYWHTEERGKDRNYHYDKWLACKKFGIQLIQIWEDDWNLNKNLILTALAHKLGKSITQKVYARKTEVVQLTTSQAKLFMNANHIQGFASGSYYLGLQDKNGINQAVIILKKESTNNLNIIRYATAINVVGGFTKLLKYAQKTYTPDMFITFADHCISDGSLYEKSGFVADKEIPPDYMYVVKNKRNHKFGYRLKKFKNDPNLMWQQGLTESQLAQLNSIPRIWDAGKTRYILQNNDTIKPR